MVYRGGGLKIKQGEISYVYIDLTEKTVIKLTVIVK